jgi:hypothetical protein
VALKVGDLQGGDRNEELAAITEEFVSEQVAIPSALAASTGDPPLTENRLSAPSYMEENGTTGTPAGDTDTDASGPAIGPIVGGIAGGLVFIAVVVVVVVRRRQRDPGSQQPSPTNDEPTGNGKCVGREPHDQLAMASESAAVA